MKLRSSWSIVAGAAAAACLAALPDAPAVPLEAVPAAATGTVVCGSMSADTTWDGAGSPYLVCDEGVTFTAGALTISGTQGPVSVVATGRGGLGFHGGRLRTSATSAAAPVTFDSVSATPGTWAGISAQLGTFSIDQPAIVAEHLVIRNAVTGLTTRGGVDVEVRHSVVEDSSIHGVAAFFGTLTLEDSQVRDSGRIGIQTTGNHSRLRRNLVDGAGEEGMSLLQVQVPNLVDNHVTRTGRATARPAVHLRGRFRLDTDTGVRGTTGTANALNAALLGGDVPQPFTWRSPVVGGAEERPALGYLNEGLRVSGAGTLTVPAGAVVKSTSGGNSNPFFFDDLGPNNGMLVVGTDALHVEAGAVFTTIQDDSVGIPTCASAVSQTCTPARGSWVGIITESADVRMSGATIAHAVTGLLARHEGSSRPAASSTRLTDVTVRHVERGLVTGSADLTRVLVQDTARIDGLGVEGVDVYGAARLRDVTTEDAGVGIRLSPSSPTDVLDAQGLTARRSAGPGVWVHPRTGPSYTSPILRDVTVTDSAGAGTDRAGGQSAVQLSALRMRVGAGRDVDRIAGSGNGLDAIALSGSVEGGLTWRPLPTTPATSPAELGYVGKGGVLALEGGALTVPPGALVKAAGFTLNGATWHSDAASAFTWVSPNNPDFAPRTCSLSQECGRSGAGFQLGGPFTLLTLAKDAAGTPSSVRIAGSTLHDASQLNAGSGSTLELRATRIHGQSPPAAHDFYQILPQPQVIATDATAVISDSELRGIGVVSETSRLTVQRTAIRAAPGIGVSVRGGTGSSLSQVAVEGASQTGVRVIGTSLSLSRTRVAAGPSTTYPALYTGAGGRVTGRCNAVRDFAHTFWSTADAGSSVLTDSDVHRGAARPEVLLGAPLDAQRVWWGQAGGPRSDQVNHPERLDASDPAATSAPSATLDVTGPRDSSGHYTAGTLSAVLTFNRAMDSSVKPAVTLTGDDGVQRAFTGSWRDERSWSGSYVLTSSSAAKGRNRVEARDARGCVLDPTTNLMTPAQREITTASGYDTAPASPTPAPSPTGPAPSTAPSPTASPTASPTPAATSPTATASPSPTTAPSASPTAAPSPTHGQLAFTALTPARVLDTRNGTGGLSGRLADSRPVSLRVTGRGGVPATGVSAVVLNTTVTGASANGHLTVFPGDEQAPEASNLNFRRGQTVPNLVVVPVGPDGTVRLVANAGSPHVVADVVGWYGERAELRFNALTPARVLDSRSGTGTNGRLENDRPRTVRVTGRGGVPLTGVSAVVLNTTVTGPSASGFLTVFPGGQGAPLASNLNFATGQTVANAVVVPVSADGSIQLVANAGAPHVVADVVGWYGGQSGVGFSGLSPARVMDTRDGTGVSGGRLRADQPVTLALAGRGGLPDRLSAVVLNVTATGPSASGHLTVFPGDGAPPTASSLNFGAGQTVPNLVVVPVAPDGTVRLVANAGAPHVVADVVGWFAPTS